MGIHVFLIIAFLFVWVQGRVYKKWGFKGISYTRNFDRDHCHEGDEVRLVEQVVNRKILPVPWLRLEATLSSHLKFPAVQRDLDVSSGKDMQNHKSFFSLMPFTKITRTHKIVCLKRGIYQLDSAAITCGDSLGFFKTTRKIELDAQLLVYPSIVPLQDIPLPSHSWQGDLSVQRWMIDDPFVIAGVREYRYGDPLNGINWKATARAGKLQVHNRDFTADHRLMIYVNFEVDEKMWKQVTDPELIEQGIRYAASMIQAAIADGMDTGFGCNGHIYGEDDEKSVRIAPYNGEGQLQLLNETMAKLVVDVKTVAFDVFLEQDVLEGEGNVDYVWITPYVSDKMLNAMERLVNNGNAVKIIALSPQDHHQSEREEMAG